MKKIIVGQYEGGERLDAYLAQQLPDFSRSYFQKLIKSGGVSINDTKPKAHTVVKEEDVIEINEAPEEKLTEEKAVLPPLDIVAETKDYLVINKPSGLLVHPAPKQQTGTLVDLLLKHDKKIAKVGDSELRPGIMHRLDRDASGLMVIAKKQEAFDDLKSQFQNHDIKKEYFALVHGKAAKDSGEIIARIGRSKDRGRMVARAQPLESDKDAKTLYDVVMRFPHATLVKVRTETGRMHQIRVHMKSIGHPLVGDTLYTPGKLRTGSLQPGRMFLHAATLGFTDLAGDWQEFHSDLPPQLHDFIEALKRKHKK